MNFLHILRGQSFGFQSFIYFLKNFKLSAFFNSADKSFQRIVPIVLTVSKPNLLVFMFGLFMVTSHLRLSELFSLREEKGPFLLYIFRLANILYFYNE